jgi:hypothetical protein
MGALGWTFEELRRDIERIAELGRCHDSGQ